MQILNQCDKPQDHNCDTRHVFCVSEANVCLQILAKQKLNNSETIVKSFSRPETEYFQEIVIKCDNCDKMWKLCALYRQNSMSVTRETILIKAN